jgi:putative ABC transport system ATP-binding protein
MTETDTWRPVLEQGRHACDLTPSETKALTQEFLGIKPLSTDDRSAFRSQTAVTHGGGGNGVSLSVKLTDVVREYRAGGQTVRALDGLTLCIIGGQFTSVVGPSGAGKSTLLHLLGALDSPDSGSIRFDGVEIGTMTDDQQSTFRRRKVGFIFQFFNLLPTLTAWENVAIPKLLDGRKLRQVRPDAIRLLELVGLGNRIDHRPAELSGGQMQRVAVARALMMDPPLILADEPTGNLDSATGAAILELLQSVAHDDRAHRAVVMVTHNLEAAAETDRVITLQDGALKSDMLTAEAPQAGRHARNRHEPATDQIVRVCNGVPKSDVLIADPLRVRQPAGNPV